MRRVLALLLLAGFSLPLIAPLFASRPDEASLPACCRRNGQHHCAMTALAVEIPSRYQTVSEKCPWSPFAGAALMLPHALVGQHALLLAGRSVAAAAPVGDAEAGYRVSADRSRQKRGPPSLLGL